MSFAIVSLDVVMGVGQLPETGVQLRATRVAMPSTGGEREAEGERWRGG